MVSNGNPGMRSISTGALEIDNVAISIELDFETYRASGTGAQAIDNYEFTGRLPLIATDKGIILKEIRQALKEGREVTAETEKLGRSEFIKVGPVVIGLSENQSPESIGRFGLKKVLGI